MGSRAQTGTGREASRAPRSRWGDSLLGGFKNSLLISSLVTVKPEAKQSVSGRTWSTELPIGRKENNGLEKWRE